MTLIGFVSTLIQFTLFCIGVVLFVFALIGIGKVYSDYKESKWQKQYGDKLEKDTERNRWENMELLRDRTFLLEEVIRDNSIESNIDRIDRIISEVDYDARYNACNKNEAKWNFYAVSMIGSSEKAQAEVVEDFERYEEQRKQELRDKLNKTI